VVEFLPRESGQVVDDDEVDLAFVLAAERQQLEQPCAIGGLRAFAFLFEPLKNLEAFAGVAKIPSPRSFFAGISRVSPDVTTVTMPSDDAV
jgi:hypothetical protein